MSGPDPALLSINTATVRAQWPLPDIISGLARHGIRGIAPWRDQVAAAGLDDTARRIRDAGLVVTGLCRGGMFPAPDREARRAAHDDNRRAVDEALTLGAQCLVLVVGGLPKDRSGTIVSRDLAGAREMVRDGIGLLHEYAHAAGLRLACVNTLAQANALCEELAPNGDDGLGVAVDVYHVWWDPDLQTQILRAGERNRLYAYHICDWLVPTRDLLNDRGMMGDGVIDLPRIRAWMEAAGYRGMHEVEIFSAQNWWKRDADDVLTTCRQRHADAS
jgi:sugar phosphate isomerase/epimerase